MEIISLDNAIWLLPVSVVSITIFFSLRLLVQLINQVLLLNIESDEFGL
ncbi:hypothetical protein Riv7116_6136 [Rivularia sp. PCC 7116]|nr:hypothetical protein Riv7116_6136 [Rivularia sp. PCC 7116]